MSYVPPLDSDSLERLVIAMLQAQDAQGLIIQLDPEEVFSPQIVNQLKGCGFIRVLQ